MPIATLIGDVRQARRAPDRDTVHQRLAAVLTEVNDQFDPVTPLRITVGDEYQGGFADRPPWWGARTAAASSAAPQTGSGMPVARPSATRA